METLLAAIDAAAIAAANYGKAHAELQATTETAKKANESAVEPGAMSAGNSLKVVELLSKARTLIGGAADSKECPVCASHHFATEAL